jgi:hypothetical protein
MEYVRVQTKDGKEIVNPLLPWPAPQGSTESKACSHDRSSKHRLPPLDKVGAACPIGRFSHEGCSYPGIRKRRLARRAPGWGSVLP